MMNKRAITFIGMPGVGKSSIGKQIAKSINWTFEDTDTLIQKHINGSLKSFIEEQGDSAFRQLEESIVTTITEFNNKIIATGGSVVYSEKSMSHLKKNTTIIYLYDSQQNIEKRVKASIKQRGIVGLTTSFKDLYEERLPLYEKYSDITIELPSPFHIETCIKTCLNKVQEIL